MMAEYASPVLRAASPASSVGTAYGPDRTTFSDSEHCLGQSMFEYKWEERMQLGEPLNEELLANRDPLLPHPRSEAEERALYEKVMDGLRSTVAKLEEDELFDQTLLRGSIAGKERQPSSSKIDNLMRSMMPVQTVQDSTSTSESKPKIQGGPWSRLTDAGSDATSNKKATLQERLYGRSRTENPT